MGYEVLSYTDMEKKALAVAKSGLFGCRAHEQIITLFLIAEAERVPVMQAVMDYDIIEGKPALKAEARLRRFQANGGVVKWVDRSDTKVSAYFSHPVHCPDPILVSWDMEQAKRAGLSTKIQKDGKPNMWQKFPRQMLTARVIGEGTKAVAPDNASGIYTPEEVADFNNDAPMQTVMVDGKTVVSERKEVKEELKQPAPKPQAQEAEIVPDKLSARTLEKFEMVKGVTGEEMFKNVLKAFGLTSVSEIKSEADAKEILRDMRIAVESMQAEKEKSAQQVQEAGAK